MPFSKARRTDRENVSASPRDRLFLGYASATLRCLASHHDDVSANIAAEVHQLAKVLGTALTHLRIGVIHEHAFGLHQHPMDAGDLNAHLLGCLADTLRSSR
jgi:hypothetical protein